MLSFKSIDLDVFVLAEVFTWFCWLVHKVQTQVLLLFLCQNLWALFIELTEPTCICHTQKSKTINFKKEKYSSSNFFERLSAMQANLPKNTPFLPGMSYADPTITRYHKTQLLGVTNGIQTGKLKTSASFSQRRYKITAKTSISNLILTRVQRKQSISKNLLTTSFSSLWEPVANPQHWKGHNARSKRTTQFPELHPNGLSMIAR